MSEFRDAVLRYARRGWPMIPCSGKRPTLPHGLLEASTDAETVAEWWRRWPSANVAVRTGRESKLLIG